MNVLSELERQSRREYVSPYHIALIYGALGDRDPSLALQDWNDGASLRMIKRSNT